MGCTSGEEMLSMLEVISSTRLFTNFAATCGLGLDKKNQRVLDSYVSSKGEGGEDVRLGHRDRSSIGIDRACRSIIAP